MGVTFVGLDIGTSAVKAIAIDEQGRVLAEASHDVPLHTPEPRWAEQEASDMERAAMHALHALAIDRDAVKAIGLTGQMHSAMLLDDKNEIVRRAILWCDGRTTEQCRAIEDAMGREGLARTVRNRALEGFTLPKLLWLREHEPEIFSRVRRVVMPKDWIGYRLTGVLETDVSDASGTLAFDPVARAWSKEILERVGIDAALFPRAEESVTPLGKTKLFPNAIVVRGGADNACAAVGLGIVKQGRAMISIGTSGVVLAHRDVLEIDPEMRLHAFAGSVPRGSYAMGVMLSAGGALRWYRDSIARRSYEEILALAKDVPPGAGGVLFLPYLMGERTPHADANARAALVGMTASTTEAHVARAVIEGITYGLADSLELVGGAEELRVTGGGAKSEIWRQILADAFGTPIVTTSSASHGPSFGAAILAASSGDVANAADALVRIVDRSEPRPEMRERHRAAHAHYRELYRDLSDRFRALANI